MGGVLNNPPRKSSWVRLPLILRVSRPAYTSLNPLLRLAKRLKEHYRWDERQLRLELRSQ